MSRRKIHIIRYALLLSLSLAAVAPVFAQSLHWAVDFNTIFDNREGSDRYTESKTFFQTKLAPEVGLSMDGGKHLIAGGLSWTQPIGNGWKGYQIQPTVYYQFRTAKVRFNFGMFPKEHLYRSLPNYIWNDSIQYNQSNIRGLQVSYQRAQGFFEAIVDWRGMQTREQREAFNIIARGEWQPRCKPFMLGGLVMMNHLAKRYDPPEDERICDNFMTHLYVGVNLSHLTVMDSLTVRAGWLVDLTRNRTDDRWRAPSGFLLDVATEWRFLGLTNTFYIGKSLYPYYSTFRWTLNQGEAYYQSPWFDRLSIYGYIFRRPFMNLSASLDFNFAKENFSFYQRILLRVYLDEDIWHRRKELPKGEYLSRIY